MRQTEPETVDVARERWLEQRRSVITGTDAAQIVAMDADPVTARELARFGGAMGVYLEKIGEPLPVEITEAITAGRRFERPILEYYAEREKAPIRFEEPWTLVRSSEVPEVGATLDARRLTGEPVDAKNIRVMEPRKWGDEFSDEMPLYYAAQLVMQMHVTGAAFADLAVLFSGQDLRVFRLHRDLETETTIVGRCVEFMRENVAKRIPPPVDGSPAWTAHLKRAFAKGTDVILEADAAMTEVAHHLANARAQRKEIEATETFLENRIKATIGEAGKIIGPDWRASWATVQPTIGTDWEALAHRLAAMIDGLEKANGEPIVGAYEEALKLFDAFQIQTRAGYRRFTFTPKGR